MGPGLVLGVLAIGAGVLALLGAAAGSGGSEANKTEPRFQKKRFLTRNEVEFYDLLR